MKKIFVSEYVSPVGVLLLGDFEGRLCLCDWNTEQRRRLIAGRVGRRLGAVIADGRTPLIEKAGSQLEEYFSGTRRQFDLPLQFAGTEFQEQVWERLLSIGYGETLTYSDLSKAVGRPAAVRAVGTAVGANAMSVIVPCHRVLASGGGLGGYAGGIAAKQFLLDLERSDHRVAATEV